MADRLKAFKELMLNIDLFDSESSFYRSMPHYYGCDEPLFTSEIHMLGEIARAGTITVTELTALNNKTMSANSQMINRLYKKGLVTKKKLPENKRQIIISLTPKGAQVNDIHEQMDNDMFYRRLNELSYLSLDDIKRLSKLFIQLHAVYCQMNKDAIEQYDQMKEGK